jgi:hypothetical protein
MPHTALGLAKLVEGILPEISPKQPFGAGPLSLFFAIPQKEFSHLGILLEIGRLSEGTLIAFSPRVW